MFTMKNLTNSIFTIVNGLTVIMDRMFTAVGFMLVVCALSLAWFALLEADEVKRQGTKPVVGRGR